jgi:hypothetical protein
MIPHHNQNLGPFFCLRGNRKAVGIRFILKEARFYMRQWTPWQEFASPLKGTNKKQKFHEKTFTSVGGNRTGSGSGETR